MEQKNLVILIGVIVSLICKTHGVCDKTPPGVVKPRNRNDIGRYVIEIPGNPKTYTPNQKYNISLKIGPHADVKKAFRKFVIASEPADGESFNDLHSTGRFELPHEAEMLSKFSDGCRNTVEEASNLPKSEIQVFWNAPPENSGCIAIIATVIESKENWFSEDGPLKKILCEETAEDENSQPSISHRCCACDEAKYEVAFEGMWTRNTHPRYFPSDVWRTKFSDIIGASHQMYSAFWKYDDIASDGLKELSESGDTKALELELKDMSEKIRTIIKARGLQYPNITKSTYAVFRVDNKNHLVSLVSKIIPSPDWIVGVSNFELCKSDCTWEESRSFNLYPWDAGTDDGITYTSSDPLGQERHSIRRITPNNPNNPESPFYSEDGEEMKPIAKLHLTRQRLYEKPCNGDEGVVSNCATTDWTDWSPCSSNCGKGKMYRQRQYIEPNEAENCEEPLLEEKTCHGQLASCGSKRNHQDKSEEGGEEKGVDGDAVAESKEVIEEENGSGEKCEAEYWGTWSSCSAHCGKGTRTRDRKLKKSENEEYCKEKIILQENEECEGEDENCKDQEENSNCPNNHWSEWSVCNTTCGTGYKIRHRENAGDDNACPIAEVVECSEPCNTEETTTPFGENLIISQGPDGRVIDCRTSGWKSWSKCDLNGAPCGEGLTYKSRHILTHPENGGTPCPKKLRKVRKCVRPCKKPNNSEGEENEFTTQSRRLAISECVMGPWSHWSPCSSICGATAVQQRTRTVLYQPPGVSCPKRLEEKRCRLPLACTDKGYPIF